MRNRGNFGRGRGRRGRHMLRPTLLFLMHQGPAHGYDLTEKLKQYGVQNIDPSLIYRALRDMEEDGYVKSDWDAEKTQGPPRRIYTLTKIGNEALPGYLEDLRSTRDRIDQLIHSYDEHMRHGSGDFHKD